MLLGYIIKKNHVFFFRLTFERVARPCDPPPPTPSQLRYGVARLSTGPVAFKNICGNCNCPRTII